MFGCQLLYLSSPPKFFSRSSNTAAKKWRNLVRWRQRIVALPACFARSPSAFGVSAVGLKWPQCSQPERLLLLVIANPTICHRTRHVCLLNSNSALPYRWCQTLATWSDNTL